MYVITPLGEQFALMIVVEDGNSLAGKSYGYRTFARQ